MNSDIIVSSEPKVILRSSAIQRIIDVLEAHRRDQGAVSCYMAYLVTNRMKDKYFLNCGIGYGMPQREYKKVEIPGSDVRLYFAFDHDPEFKEDILEIEADASGGWGYIREVSV